MPVRVAVLAFAVLAVACQSPEAPAPELALAPVVATSEPPAEAQECSRLLDDADLTSIEGRHQVVVATVDAVRAGECDPIAPGDRVCRSLFLIGATDPLVGIGSGLTGSMIDELVEQHVWVLDDGVAAAVANGDNLLAAALTELVALDIADAVAAGPDAVAALAIARAHLSIIEPIAEAEASCRNP